MGILQLAWSRSWKEPDATQAIRLNLSATLEIWRKRRPVLSLLLGATPALYWQVYQLAYLAMNPGSTERLMNLLFLTIGGPLLWVLATWLQWARIEVWILHIERALHTFDEEATGRFIHARRRAGRRLGIIATLLLLLLLAGIILFRTAA